MDPGGKLAQPLRDTKGKAPAVDQHGQVRLGQARKLGDVVRTPLNAPQRHNAFKETEHRKLGQIKEAFKPLLGHLAAADARKLKGHVWAKPSKLGDQIGAEAVA